MNTYVTSTEMTYFYAQFLDYLTTERTEALKVSYGLTNSFLSSAVRVPAVQAWDGEAEEVNAPAILKLAQARFCQYLLEQHNMGWTDESQNLYDGNVAMLRDVREGELNVESVQVSLAQSGWTIVGADSDTGTLNVLAPSVYGYDYPVTYLIEIDSQDDGLYPYSTNNDSQYATYKWKELGDSAWRDTEQKCRPRWDSVGTHSLSILFEGKFDGGDSWTIRAEPLTGVNTADSQNPSRQLASSRLHYK
jgi:hypothetical protein